MTATVFFDSENEIAFLSNQFLNSAGMPADPTTIACTVTDPSGAAVVHTYGGAAPADIVKVSTGKYTLSVACSPAVPGVDGLWGYEWDGTGGVSDTQPGTWRVLPSGVSGIWYVGLEEMKDRLSITDSADDYALQTSIAAAAGFTNEYTGRFFGRVTEARTYQPDNIWVLDVDDIVPGTAITMTVDQDGDGIYEQAWTAGTDYVLRYGPGRYNQSVTGIPRPYRQIQIVSPGKQLPFTYPYTHLDRVRILTTWGWPSVPWQVTEANRLLAADIFKMKDAPFGVSGISDLGVIRAQANPMVIELLGRFVNPRFKVGI